MNKVVKEFVSSESGGYGFRIGRAIASGLSGFIGGAIFASIAWWVIVYFLSNA